MSNRLDVETQKSFEYLREVEEVAQEVLTDKQTKLEIANAQNKYREAFRGLEETEDRQTWIKLGLVYVQLPTEECKCILKEEINNADRDLEDLNAKVKSNLQKLRDLEHQPRIEGVGLKPLSTAEVKVLHKNFGSI